MQKTKLINLLRQLLPEEFKKLKKFVHSPYFNSNKSIPKLYEFFVPFYPDFDSKKMTQTRAIKIIYNKTETNPSKKVVDLMSDMYKLVVEYIRQLEYEKDKVGQGKYMAEAYAGRGYFDSFEKELNTLKTKIENLPYRNVNYYWDLYDIERKRYLRVNIGQVEYSKDSLETMMNSLEGIHDLGKLKLNLEMYSRKQLLKEDFKKLDEANKIYTLVGHSDYKNVLSQQIYVNLLKMITEEDANAFKRAKQLFFDNHKHLTQNNQKDILGYLVNFTIGQWNKGKRNFTLDGFEILEFGFKKRLFLDVLYIESLFISLVLKGIYLKKYNQLQQFLNQYDQFLKEEYRESVVIFCKSSITFNQKKYSKTRNLLMSYNFVRPIDKLRAKSLLIRAIYEDFKNDESEFYLLNSQIMAFRKYLKRNKKLSQSWITSYLNFLNFIGQITRLLYNKKKNPLIIQKLLAELQLLRVISNKTWLQEKLIEIY